MILSKLFTGRTLKSLLAAAALMPALTAATAQAEISKLSSSLTQRVGAVTTMTAHGQGHGGMQYRFSYKEAVSQQWIIIRGWGRGNQIRFHKDITRQTQGLVKLRVEARKIGGHRVLTRQEMFFEENIRDHYLMPIDITLGNQIPVKGRQLTMTGVFQGDAPHWSFREYFVFHENDSHLTKLGQRSLSHHQFGNDAHAINRFRTASWTPNRPGKWYMGVKVVWQDQYGRTGTHYHVESLTVRQLQYKPKPGLVIKPGINKKPVIVIRPKFKGNKKPVLVIRP